MKIYRSPRQRTRKKRYILPLYPNRIFDTFSLFPLFSPRMTMIFTVTSARRHVSVLQSGRARAILRMEPVSMGGRAMEQQTFFAQDAAAPLAARLRPQTLEEIVGQRHLLGEGKVLRRLIEDDHISSMIFWGPPGVGKTTLARVIANRTKAAFIDFSAVTSGIREIRAVMEKAEEQPPLWGAHHRLCRRDPPLQQGAAGRFSALCGERQHHPHRRDHGKPLL